MSDNFTVKDSGKRENFNTGAVRDTSDGKPRPDLISPFFLKRLGIHMGKGAKKYSAHNWAKGIPNSRCYESCMRHLMQFAMGDRTEDHLAAAAFNIMAMIHNEEVSADNVDFVEKSGAVGLVDMPVFVKVDEAI
jgi:hypothetical protein